MACIGFFLGLHMRSIILESEHFFRLGLSYVISSNLPGVPGRDGRVGNLDRLRKSFGMGEDSRV